MHEFSIASQIWETVSQKARERGGGRVIAITLEVGALNLFEDDQLRFWIGMLAERGGSPEVELRITHSPGRVHCNECDVEGEVAFPGIDSEHLTPALAACPACGSRDVRVTGGRELRVASAEIEAESACGPSR